MAEETIITMDTRSAQAFAQEMVRSLRSVNFFGSFIKEIGTAAAHIKAAGESSRDAAKAADSAANEWETTEGKLTNTTQSIINSLKRYGNSTDDIEASIQNYTKILEGSSVETKGALQSILARFQETKDIPNTIRLLEDHLKTAAHSIEEFVEDLEEAGENIGETKDTMGDVADELKNTLSQFGGLNNLLNASAVGMAVPLGQLGYSINKMVESGDQMASSIDVFRHFADAATLGISPAEMSELRASNKQLVNNLTEINKSSGAVISKGTSEFADLLDKGGDTYFRSIGHIGTATKFSADMLGLLADSGIKPAITSLNSLRDGLEEQRKVTGETFEQQLGQLGALTESEGFRAKLLEKQSDSDRLHFINQSIARKNLLTSLGLTADKAREAAVALDALAQEPENRIREGQQTFATLSAIGSRYASEISKMVSSGRGIETFDDNPALQATIITELQRLNELKAGTMVGTDFGSDLVTSKLLNAAGPALNAVIDRLGSVTEASTRKQSDAAKVAAANLKTGATTTDTLLDAGASVMKVGQLISEVGLSNSLLGAIVVNTGKMAFGNKMLGAGFEKLTSKISKFAGFGAAGATATAATAGATETAKGAIAKIFGGAVSKGVFGKMFGGVAAGVLGGVTEYGKVKNDDSLTAAGKTTKVAGSAIGGAAGGWAGMQAGAALGAAGGPIGIALGALIGGAAGGLLGTSLAAGATESLVDRKTAHQALSDRKTLSSKEQLNKRTDEETFNNSLYNPDNKYMEELLSLAVSEAKFNNAGLADLQERTLAELKVQTQKTEQLNNDLNTKLGKLIKTQKATIDY